MITVGVPSLQGDGVMGTIPRQKRDSDLFPYRTQCARCGGAFHFLVLDRRFCSYECAGIPVPDAQSHPVSCWTEDGKPKMGFSTPDAAWCMCVLLALEGVKPYYCPLHHFWHVGYLDGTEKFDTKGDI